MEIELLLLSLLYIIFSIDYDFSSKFHIYISNIKIIIEHVYIFVINSTI
jgi:hypothetical protein